MQQRVLAVAGTRPEAIKLSSVAFALRRRGTLTLLNSGQHRAAVGRAFAEFGLHCDAELDDSPPSHNMTTTAAQLLKRMRAFIRQSRPVAVVVQGDTLTAYCAALASAAEQVACVHVEAGLRTESALHPFPEEFFRRRIARFAQLHFAPTARAKENLAREGVGAESIRIVGNTGIDMLARVMREERAHRDSRLVVVTLHRRENWGANMGHVCAAIRRLLEERPDLVVVFPVHPNPATARRVESALQGVAQVRLVHPMSYRAFVALARSARLIISDSGGIQEEAPHIGTPLLVPRCNTERPEALETGFVRLVDVSHGPKILVDAARSVIAAGLPPPLPIDGSAPFGDGKAGPRIAKAVLEQLETVA